MVMLRLNFFSQSVLVVNNEVKLLILVAIQIDKEIGFPIHGEATVFYRPHSTGSIQCKFMFS